MIQWMQKHLALSEKGAKELIKGMLWSALSYMTLMIPMSIIIMFLNEVLSPVLSGEQVAPNLFLYIGLGVVAILLMIPFHWLQYGSVFIATYNESANKRVTLAEKLRKLPLSFFGQRDVSDLTSTIMSDCTGMEHAFSHAVPQLGGSLIFTIFVIIMLFIVNWQMGLALFWVFPISLIMVFGSKKLQDRAGQAHLDAKVNCAEGIQECLETVRELKAYNRKEEYLHSLFKKMDRAEKAQIKSELTTDTFLATGQAFLRLGLVTVILTGGTLLVSGETTLLTYFMFLMAATRI